MLIFIFVSIEELEERIRVLEIENSNFHSKNETLHSKNKTLHSKNKTLHSKVDELLSKNENLSALVARLQKIAFGKRSEKAKLLLDPNQMSLLGKEEVEALVKVVTEELDEQESRTKKKIGNRYEVPHTGRNKLPEHLEVIEHRIEPEEDVSNMKFVKDIITETLDYIPGKLIRKRIIRPLYVEITKSRITKKKKERLVCAEMPSRPIEKGIPEAALLAYLCKSKFVDHLPFYRIIEIFKREFNYEISRATISRWFAKCCKLIKPIFEEVKKEILSQDYLMVDETPIKVQEDGKPGACHQGYLWLYEDPRTRLVIYDYRRSRKAEGPSAVLENFKGAIQTDGYSGYEKLNTLKEDIDVFYCWAHARRKFVEAYDFDKASVGEVIDWIGKLYGIEKNLREQNATNEKRFEVRQSESKPILASIKKWCVGNASKHAAHPPIAKAIKYVMKRWLGFIKYCEDGKYEIDNNFVENSVRPVALGRKNYLFTGTHEFAEHTAMMYSLMTCCKRHNIDPQAWLKDIFERIPNHKINKIGELMPNNWKVREG